MKKLMIYTLCLSLLLPVNLCLAMGSTTEVSTAAGNAVNTANEVGNNDAVQEAAGRVGEAAANFGSNQVDNAWNHTNSSGQLTTRAQQAADNGTRIFATGKAVEYGAKAAPHVGWMATSAGNAYEGDYDAAAIEAINGAGRTLTVAHVGTAVGTAAGVWVGGKLGAVAGSWAGPAGAAAGFIIGCGAAYIGGKIWDAGIGKGKDALIQKNNDWKAEIKYGGTGGGRRRSNARNNSRNTVKGMRPPVRPSGGSGSGRCDCGRGR